MKPKLTCPNCGKTLAPGALEGLCPECMLKVGVAAESLPTEPIGPGGTVVIGSSAQLSPISLGQELGGYRILHRLGHGGMGVVYEAEEKESCRRIALKVIGQKLSSSADRTRFLREGRLAASVNHPNCVYVFGTEEIDGLPVIAMELVEGGTLQQRVSQQGPLTVTQAVDALLQVIAGLEAAQAVGILHRDIKPSNCFECPNGTVKIGDFGLSISTSARAEADLTESGALLGTPAFCSPEQLRGHDLTVQSDIYAVGVTLFYLLTGRQPFEGATLPQLVANTLEKRAPSPRQFRNEIPNGLARIILRCLDKQPGERFKSYPALRRALEPYASLAPTPATLGLRFLAGVIDLIALGVLGQLAVALFVGSPFTVMEQLLQGPAKALLIVVPTFLLAVSYYAVCEWRWGATVGKALCRLRVVQEDRSFPSVGKAFLRGCIYVIAPASPYWVIAAADPSLLMGGFPMMYLLSLSCYGIIALLFVTARRRNGFSAVHDLVTRTRVVSRTVLEQRPQMQSGEARPAEVETRPMVGPYHVLEPLGPSGEIEWIMGYDLKLLRRVLIRMVPAGTPPLPKTLQRISRVGRLRWLTGRRETTENWDAFEGSAGQALVNLVDQPQSWAQVRFWLHDLALELVAAEKDQTIPEVLALNRVWITGEGRAKLLDFPAPGASQETEGERLKPAQGSGLGARTFLQECAAVALNGNPTVASAARRAPLLLPLRAQQFLQSLSGMISTEQVVLSLEPLLRRAAVVTRARRVMLVTACLIVPLFMGLAMLVGTTLLQNWRRANPEFTALSDVLQAWNVTQMPWAPKAGFPSDRQFGIYLAAHHRAVITNEAVWSGALARTFINRKARQFAERSLADYAAPSPEELAEAEAKVKPIAQAMDQNRAVTAPAMGGPRFLVMMIWICLLIYVGLPSIIAALAFRGGLVLFALGVTYLRRDGARASRLRLFWRSLVGWSPVLGAAMVSSFAMAKKSPLLSLLSAMLVLALTVWSLLLPERGLQDRLAGTWPVPR